MDRHAWKEPIDEHILHEDLIISRDAMMHVTHGKGLLIFVRMGTVWITQERDPLDKVLGPGQWFRLDREGLAVIGALHGASVTISASLGLAPKWRMTIVPPLARRAVGTLRPALRPGFLVDRFWAWWSRLYRWPSERSRRSMRSYPL
ncbi:MAG: DUF2917 domain-containing protein [Burkholderiales bacterium]